MSTAAEHHHGKERHPVIQKSPSALDFPTGGGTHDDLNPPADVSFFKKEDFTIFNNESLKITGPGNIDSRVTWKVKTYMYATGADPRKGDYYAQHNGETIIIMVHSGSVHHSPTTSLNLSGLAFGIQLDPTDGLSVVAQLPSTGSGVQDGKNHKYSIDYSKTLAMSKNDGQDVTSVNIGYSESFTRFASEQDSYASGYIQSFSINPVDTFAMQSDNEIHGLTVLSTKKGGDWKPKLKFSYAVFTSRDPLAPGTTITKDYSPDLKFT